jgi:hypothetical protein
MLRDIGYLLMALGEIPGLKFLKDIGPKMANVGRKAERIQNRARSVKRRVDKYRDKDDAA